MTLQNASATGAGADVGATGHVVDHGTAGRQRASTELPAAGAADDTEGLMTSKIGSAVTAKVMQRITGPSGVNAGLAALTQAERGVRGPGGRGTGARAERGGGPGGARRWA